MRTSKKIMCFRVCCVFFLFFFFWLALHRVWHALITACPSRIWCVTFQANMPLVCSVLSLTPFCEQLLATRTEQNLNQETRKLLDDCVCLYITRNVVHANLITYCRITGPKQVVYSHPCSTRWKASTTWEHLSEAICLEITDVPRLCRVCYVIEIRTHIAKT